VILFKQSIQRRRKNTSSISKLDEKYKLCILPNMQNFGIWDPLSPFLLKSSFSVLT